MNDHSKLKALAEATDGWQKLLDCWPAEIDDDEDDVNWFVGSVNEDGEKYPVLELNTAQYDAPEDTERLARFYAAANPAAVLALIAENELISSTKRALVKERQAHIRQRDQLKAELESVQPHFEDVERLCKVLGYLGVSTPEGGEEQAARWLSLVRTMIRTAETSRLLRHDAEKIAEYDQLRAENAGLKTGYEAYEQVVEGLRAELDEAKQFQSIGEACLSNRDTLRASLGLKLGDHLHEHVEGLRKDAERYRWMRERDLETVHRGGVFAGVTPENLVLNGNDLDDRIDAAMDKGIAVQGDVISGRVVGN